jgi:hypothetical protein
MQYAVETFGFEIPHQITLWRGGVRGLAMTL